MNANAGEAIIPEDPLEGRFRLIEGRLDQIDILLRLILQALNLPAPPAPPANINVLVNINPN